MSKLLLSIGLLLFISPMALAQSNPVDDTAKAVNDAGAAVSNGISEQTQWIGKTVDDFLTDPTEAPPPAPKSPHKSQKKS